MNKRLSFVMIVRNESDQLVACLESVKPYVDEIIIVDTGSSDNTREIAQRYTPYVFEYAWTHDFSAARNFALAKASGDWILTLDADERLVGENIHLRQWIEKANDHEAYLIPLHNPTSQTSSTFNSFHVLRLFKNHARFRYTGKIHEQITIDDPSKIGMLEDPVIVHQTVSQKKLHQKRNRNLTLLKESVKNDPTNPFLAYYLGVEWLMLEKPHLSLPYLEFAYMNLMDTQILFKAPALKYLIHCLKDLGRLDDAIALCLEGNIRYPDFTDLVYFGGILFEEKREYKMAAKWFSKAIQLGCPPTHYSHLSGSEDFLAYYHLGYSYECLGQIEDAKTAHESALVHDPSYFYPLFNLFRILLEQKGILETYHYIIDKIPLPPMEECLALASLFLTAGFPDFSWQYLDHWKREYEDADIFQYTYGKYCGFSGRLQLSLKWLQKIRYDSPFWTSAQEFLIINQLILGKYANAKKLIHRLWKTPSLRYKAYTFYCLMLFMEKCPPHSFATRIRDKDSLQTTMDLLMTLKQYTLSQRDPHLLVPLLENTEALIQHISIDGVHRLLAFYDEKILEVRSTYADHFRNGWDDNES